MKRLLSYRFRRTTLWLVFFVSVLCGIGLAKTSLAAVCLRLLILAPIVALSLRRRGWQSLVLVALFGMACGCWRGTNYLHQLSEVQAVQYHPITIHVVALNDALYDKHKQLAFDASKLTIKNGQKLTGKVHISGFGVNAVFAGDELDVTGKLRPSYGSYVGRISFAKLTVVAHHPSVVTELRQKFTAGMQTALPEPLAPFAMGLLVGQRATLPAEIKQDLQMVGLTHIIAVSGYNLTIILHASRRLFGGFSKRLATLFSICLIIVFLLLAGSSASIVRAAIVSMLSIAASYYGRSFKPLNLIAMAAVITAWANPLYAWSDLSWYLSFLAFFGVMVLSPLIQKRWPARWHQSLLGSVALESVCAEIMSLPFILHIFGQMSLIGLPANVLVVTLVPIAMLLALFAGLAGMFVPLLFGWIALPAVLLLNYMLDTAHLLAGLPHIFVEDRSLSLTAMLGLYVLVAGLVTLLTHKTKRQRAAIITDIKQPTKQGLAT